MSHHPPPRKRSLFMRGYDRVGLQVDGVRHKPRFRFQRPLVLLVVVGFLLLVGWGMARSLGKVTSPPVLRVDPDPAPITTPSTKPKLKVAVAITVTKDGPYLDGAAVLQHSVRMTNSHHDVEMVALVHSEVQSTRPALRALGFKVVEFALPIRSEEIQGKHLRETIDKSGCCGAQELLKLCSWMLLDYDRVVAMDMDAIWLANLDHLLERDIAPGGYLFTYDFAMDTPGSRSPPVQGGFQLIRPDEYTYNRLVDIVRVGDFRPGTGWGGLNVGWYWGGQTIQGLLAYFSSVVEPNLSYPLDPCTYNSMATTRTCRRIDFDSVQTIHYTYCQKPWECRRGEGLCAKFLHAWWMVRQDLERAQSLPETPRCCDDRKVCPHARRYQDLAVASMLALPMNDRAKPVLPQGQHIVQVPPSIGPPVPNLA